ncbi:MAG: alpha/beta hydrolase [SAR324 cluster bacterium]|nr:alpha/beta hydrolase [SAR324 cluster bacterium]
MLNNIPYTDFGGTGPLLHFAHANGYPPGSYRQLIDLLKPHFHVIAITSRQLWQNPDLRYQVPDWQVFADDLIQLLETQIQEPVYAVGHSMGAVMSWLASIKRPELFKSLVLMDPVFLPSRYVFQMKLMPEFLKTRVPLIRKALNRPDLWNSRQEAFDFHRSKKVFERLSDESMWDYINHGTKAYGNGQFTLTCPRTWEAHCYGTVPYIWKKLRRKTPPLLGLRGEWSDALLPESWQRWQSLQPEHHFVEVPQTGHLLPMERPAIMAQEILAFLRPAHSG